ncbi:MAG: crossover junction endodeoxyribonuclease RuvC [Chlamydiia bacterium]
MIVLGIDPGTVITGYGLVRVIHGRATVLDYGVVRPSPKARLTQRYLTLYEAMVALVEKFQPTCVSIETQFVAKNPQSALKLGMARGVLMLAATQKDIPIFQYAPTKAKQAVTGYGHASKPQVQAMVAQLLGLAKVPEPEDAADALALALCHVHAYNAVSLIGELV